MPEASSAHKAATATHADTNQQRTDRTRRTSADPQRAQQGATAAAAAAPAALDSLSRLQQLADASPQVAQLRRLQELADARFAPVAQLAGVPEEEELVQGKFASAELQPQLQLQLQKAPRANKTGLPDNLKSGIESLSGLSMDHVRVHFNSSQPAQLNALAYAQGSDIHLAPGQERHLPHEAWHVVQQAQGRVRPTMQMKDGVPVNDDAGLEWEADVMGGRALRHLAQLHSAPADVSYLPKTAPIATSITPLIQCFRDTNGTEVDAHKLTPSQIEAYLATPGLIFSAYIELRQAHRAKQFKMGFDESAARRKRVEAADDRRKKSRAAKVELRRMGNTVNSEPTFEFDADGEKHTIYLASAGGQPVLMIASHPLPVVTFILELEQRFKKLYDEYTKLKIIPLRKEGDLETEFTASKKAAEAQLEITNAVFADEKSSVLKKLESERDLSQKLCPLIKNVNNFAARLGRHFETTGNGTVTRASDYYTKEMKGAQERYNVEGLVATYEAQPDYPGSGFERDHQPHNDIIEKVANLPDFKKKEVCRVAANRTQKGWTILLHHNRHAAGRTFGANGGKVTQEFMAAWKTEGSKLKTPNDRCKWVIAELKKSLSADVAKMKAVANATNSDHYKDVDELKLESKATSSLKNKIKDQILKGEDRLASTAELIEKWDTEPQ